MKRIILNVSFLVAFGAVGFGQQNGTQVSPMKVYKMESSTEEKTELTKEQEIQQCKDMITALDTKEAWIRSNPEETRIATEQGWFIKAEETRAKMRARIAELEQK